MKKETKQTVKKLIVSALIIGAIVGILYLVMRWLGWTDMTEEELQAIIRSAGIAAPLIYILISFLQVTFIPIPGMITIGAGNLVFGPIENFIYAYIGMLLGAMFAFALGKWFGRPFVNWVAGGADKVDTWVEKLKGRETVLLFFMFLFPAFPDDLLCSVAGVLPISWFAFFIMQAITRFTSVATSILFLNVSWNILERLASGETLSIGEIGGLVALGIITLLAVSAFILCYRNAEKFNGALERLADQITKRFQKKRRTVISLPRDPEHVKKSVEDYNAPVIGTPIEEEKKKGLSKKQLGLIGGIGTTVIVVGLAVIAIFRSAKKGKNRKKKKAPRARKNNEADS